MPDGVIYKPCGNRRATTCPGCAETYRRDAYQLIRAGLASAARASPPRSPPTPPSSSPSPPRPSAPSTPARSASTPARTRPAAPAGPALPPPPRRRHLRPRPARRLLHPPPAAMIPELGQPLCPDCYDYPAHVVWNNQAGELWRRTKQAIERRLGQLARHRGIPRSASPAAMAVPAGLPDPRRPRQGRRIPGPRSRPLPRPAPPRRLRPRATPDTLLPPPSGITVADLERRHPVGRRGHQLPHPAAPGRSPADGPSPGEPRSTSASSP